MTSGVRVAVIDSGIHVAHPHVSRVDEGIAFDASGAAGSDYVDRLGHGTAVAAAIQDLTPTVSLLVAKVFDRSLTASVGALVPAIGWAAAHGAALINLSLGVRGDEHRDVVRNAVAEAARHGAVVVAAGEDGGVRWLPGTLDEVLRVELDWTQPRGRFTCERRDGEVVFRTCGYPRPIPGVSPERNLKGLSFAVANMTGIAAGVMAETGVDGVAALVEVLAARGETPA